MASPATPNRKECMYIRTNTSTVSTLCMKLSRKQTILQISTVRLSYQTISQASTVRENFWIYSIK